jgi:formylmethanofuran dehydrogenase subunit E
MNRRSAALVSLTLCAACAPAGTAPSWSVQHGQPARTREPAAHRAEPAAHRAEAELEAVRRIHGGSGPWAVAGYRMGRYAMASLGVAQGSFDLDVVHHSPREVQYSCIADGAAAATGASLGKLNLSLHEASAVDMRTVYRQRSTGKTLALRLTPAFRARYHNVARAHLPKAGREVLDLPEREIFEVLP